MERTYTITTDLCPRKHKPNTDQEMVIIHNHLKHKYEVTITDFSKMVAQPYGYTWSGGLFNGHSSNNSWVSQSVIGLDFDDGKITPDQIIERLQSFNITPQLWYTTFSSTDELLKFRVVLFLNESINQKSIYDYIITMLLRLFPEADKKCRDIQRHFFGGISSTIIHNDPISLINLLNSLTINLYSSDSKSFRKVPGEVMQFIKEKSAQFPQHLYNIYRSTGFSAHNEFNKNIYHPTEIYEGEKLIVDITDLKSKFKLLNEFLSGKWLTHNELFGLATNMFYVEGGFKLMNKTMQDFNKAGKTHYTTNNFNILPYIRKVEYYPELIEKFSPYQEDWQYLNIFDLTNRKRGFVEILDPINKIGLADAESLMKDKYNEVINSGEVGKIYIFRLPTAIGKTEMILNTKATICLPTNDLKNEINDRMKIDSVITPDRLVFSDTDLNSKIDYFYRVGLAQVSTKIINSVSQDIEYKTYNESDVELARTYLNDLEKCKSTTHSVITTHNRSFYTEFKHDTIIYDEDPLNMILNIKETTITDLFSLNFVINSPDITRIMQDVNKSIPNEVCEFRGYDLDVEDIVNRSIRFKHNSNVIEFLTCMYYVRGTKDPNKIYYISKMDLPSDKKIIILSATIPTSIYQSLFGDRVEIIDFTDVEQMGNVTQYTNRSCSRDGLNKYGNDISEEVGDLPVITFMTRKKMFKNPIQELHFGNCSGSDKYKGCDIAVVGTPHHNNYEYFLICAVLGIDINEKDKDIRNRIIEYNGFRFRFNCFKGELLRQIQLSLIESDLIQAVGRARTLRTNAKVKLYSNFPLRISDSFIS